MKKYLRQFNIHFILLSNQYIINILNENNLKNSKNKLKQKRINLRK
jgi:hypothetical protein